MPDRKSYHHGNLKEALVDAAADLIEEVGPQSFTMAEAARRAGVSPAAPYRHFKGREDLLVEVARQGYHDFTQRLKAAFDQGRPNALTALQRMGLAYLDFAREKPGYYMAMFESGLSLTGNADLSHASDQAVGQLVDVAKLLFADKPADQRPPARMVANHIWAMSHGVVELFSRGQPGGRSPIPPAEMLESAVLIYLRGLGVIGE